MMTTTTQIFTLAGVVVGAVSSFLVNALGERQRFKRDMARSWQARKFDGFAEYISDIKSLSAVARRLAVAQGLHDRTFLSELSRDDAAPLLTEAESRRTMSTERLRLLADADTVASAFLLNEAVWRLVWIVLGRDADGTTAQWDRAMKAFTDAFDAFQLDARRELHVPGRHVAREDRPVPSLD